MSNSNLNSVSDSWVMPTVEDIDGYLSSRGVSKNSWKIIDSDPNTGVVMIHPVSRHHPGEDENDPVHPFTRGTVWARVNGETMMMSQSTGYMDSYTAQSIDVSEIDPRTGNLKVTLREVSTVEPYPQVELRMDGSNLSVEFNPATARFSITPFAEGFLVRMCRIRGKDYIMTHKKLDYSKSRWGSLSYREVFTKLGLPAHSELFPANVVTSPYTYVFMASYPGVITGTRQSIDDGKGYITYLGVTGSWSDVDMHKLALTRDEAERDLKEYAGPWNVQSQYDPGMRDFNDYVAPVREILPVTRPTLIPLDELEEFMKDGFFQSPEDDWLPDDRCLSGESVVINIGVHHIHVMSPSFAWRTKMRNHEPSILARWNIIAADSFTSWEDFDSKYIRATVTVEDIRKSLEDPDTGHLFIPDIPFSEEKLRNLERDVNEYRRLLFINYLLSLPKNDQRLAINFLEHYTESRNYLVDFLLALWDNKLFFVDPDTLKSKIVGSALNMNVEDAPLGKVYQKGADNRIYDVTAVKVPKGKQLVILARPHPRAESLLQKAIDYAGKKLRGKKYSSKHFRSMVVKNINFLLEKEQGNSYYQMVRQSTAWNR